MSIKKNSAGKKDDIPVFLKKVSILQSELDVFLCVGCCEAVSAVLARPRRVGRYGLSVGVYTPSLILCIRLIGA